MPSIRTLALAALLLPLAGCKSDQQPRDYKAGGGWSGNSGGVQVSLSLSQSGSSVNGSGTLAGTKVGVTGTSAAGKLMLTLRSTGYQEVHFSGSYRSSAQVDGTLNDSGFDDYSITLRKQ